jgi:hypothetical protein
MTKDFLLIGFAFLWSIAVVYRLQEIAGYLRRLENHAESVLSKMDDKFEDLSE